MTPLTIALIVALWVTVVIAIFKVRQNILGLTPFIGFVMCAVAEFSNLGVFLFFSLTVISTIVFVNIYYENWRRK